MADEPDPAVLALSIHSLRVELQRRNLSTRGVKWELCERLANALRCSATRRNVTVPARFPCVRSESPSQATSDVAWQCAEEERSSGNSDVGERSTKRQKRVVTGYVVADSVWITGAGDMAEIWDISDGYGKGNLSRSEPLYATADGKGISKHGRAARQLMALEKSRNVSVREEGRENVEHLQLSFVEAFHAAFVACKLRIIGAKGEVLNDELQAWRLFCTCDKYFARKYAAYSHYRRSGWLPRSGLKYGVDWVLYRTGTRHHAHAPYCVVLSLDPKPLEPNWIRLQNKLRVVKNVAKNLIAARVHLPITDQQFPESPEEAVDLVRISELTIDRWVS